VTGKLGQDVSVEEGYAAAGLAARSLLATLAVGVSSPPANLALEIQAVVEIRDPHA
jgi:hypothetical protein